METFSDKEGEKNHIPEVLGMMERKINSFYLKEVNESG